MQPLSSLRIKTLQLQQEKGIEVMVVLAGNCELIYKQNKCSKLVTKDQRTLKSYNLLREASTDKVKEDKQDRCNSTKSSGTSHIKGVKRKSLDSTKEHGFEAKHETNNATRDSCAEDAGGDARRRISDDPTRNTFDENVNDFNFSSKKRMKSSINNGKKIYESRGRIDKEDHKRIGRNENHSISFKEGTFEKNNSRWQIQTKLRSMEDSKTTRIVSKRTKEKVNRGTQYKVKLLTRDSSQVLFDDHDATIRRDTQLLRDRTDHFKLGELKEEKFEGLWDNQVISQEDGMDNNSRRHGKDLRQKWDQENGNKVSQHDKNGLKELKMESYFQSHHLPINFSKPQFQREDYFKCNIENQWDTLANSTNKQRTRGSHECHKKDDQINEKDAHWSTKTLKQESNSPRHQGRIIHDGTMEELARQSMESESNNHDDGKFAIENLDQSNFPRHQSMIKKDNTIKGLVREPIETENMLELVIKSTFDKQNSNKESVDQTRKLRHKRRVDEDGMMEGFAAQPKEAQNGLDLVKKSQEELKFTKKNGNPNNLATHLGKMDNDGTKEEFFRQSRETTKGALRKDQDDQRCRKENIYHSSSGIRMHILLSEDSKVVKHEVASNISMVKRDIENSCSTSKVITASHQDKNEAQLDVGGMNGQNAGHEQEVSRYGDLPQSHTHENLSVDNNHKLQAALEAGKSSLHEEIDGNIEDSRQGVKGSGHGSNVASRDISNVTPDKRERNNQAEVPEGYENPKVINALVNDHSREEKPEIQEYQGSKSDFDKETKDGKGTTRKRSFGREGDVETKLSTTKAPRKFEDALQLKQAKVYRKKEEKYNELLSRRQVVNVDRNKHDVSSQKHKHQKDCGTIHSISPNKHKCFISHTKTFGKSKSPGRSNREYTIRSSWERYEKKRHKTLAAFDSRYRRFGGGTSGLGGYSPRRRRSDAAIKTPSPPPRSPNKKKEKAWDSVPLGMGSSMIAAITAAHQATMQQALAQLVNPPVTNNMLISSSGTPSIATRLPTIPSILPSHQLHMNPAVVAVTLTQATRPLRRLYVGNVPSTVSDGELMEFMNAAMLSANANHLPRTKPCINCSVNVDKNHAFAEFLTPEDATAALAFDGVTLHGTTLKIRRPKDFVQPSIIAIVVQNGGIKSVSTIPDMVSSIVADSPHKVFVGGIPPSLNADKVKEIVTAFGQLNAYHWEVDNRKQPPQAFAFLEYMDPSATLKACAGLNGMRLGNSILTVTQATPDVDTKTATINAPFYGIPNHAKTLLEPPSCVLEFCNLVTAEDVPNFSKEDIEEIIEDVRLECSRFGNVKSTHFVQHRLLHELDRRKMSHEDEMNGGVANIGQGENVAETNVQDSTRQNINKEDIEGEVIEGQSENVEHTFNFPARTQFGTSFEVGGKSILARSKEGLSLDQSSGGNEKTYGEKYCHTNGSTKEDTGIANLPHKSQANGRVGYVETGVTSYRHEKVYMQNHDIGDHGLGLCGGSEQEIDISSREWETLHLGRVYMEFSKEESACQAAHSLHGRLFDGHKVVVNYFPLKLYQKRFHKGLGPSTFQEKQLLSLAIQQHLTAHIKD